MRNFTLTKKEQKEGFYVTIKWMHGDGDEYTSKRYGPFPNEKVLDDFLDCVSSVNGRSKPTKNTYWDTWEKETVSSDKPFLVQDLVNNIDYHHEYDCFNDNVFASLRYFSVEYVNKEGVIFNVYWKE